ncbi:MAG: CBS domain-containing protein [Bacteroidetes bacterium]|nr:CBS domain-containing protein [Bacteroidota bacterium]
MSKNVKTIDARKTIFDAAHMFRKDGFKHLAGVEDGKLLLQISRKAHS